jgi:hypothetical protein
MTSSAILGESPGSNGTLGRALGPDCTLRAYATLKCLSTVLLAELGISDKIDRGVPLLRIPYRNGTGAEVAVRLRTALEKPSRRDDRFRWEPGSKPLLYGLWRLRSEPSVTIVKARATATRFGSTASTPSVSRVPACGTSAAMRTTS